MFKSLVQRWRAYRSAIDVRVSHGAELLDSARPGWEWLADHRYLDLAGARNCMLGQVYGSYANGLQALWPDLWLGWAEDDLAVEHGFLAVACIRRASRFAFSAECVFLRRAWVAEMRRRWDAPDESASMPEPVAASHVPGDR